MNTKVLRPALSLSAIAFAVFGAFAFSSVPEKGKLIDVYGHNPLEDCDVTTVQCSTVDNPNVCRVSSNELYLRKCFRFFVPFTFFHEYFVTFITPCI